MNHTDGNRFSEKKRKACEIKKFPNVATDQSIKISDETLFVKKLHFAASVVFKVLRVTNIVLLSLKNTNKTYSLAIYIRV